MKYIFENEYIFSFNFHISKCILGARNNNNIIIIIHLLLI